MPAPTMWSAFTRAALAALALAGCGPRALDLTLTVDASGCTLMVPPGGSLSYQVEANGSASVDGGAGSFCGGCLAVSSAIASSDALVAFLRANAPSCAGVLCKPLCNSTCTPTSCAAQGKDCGAISDGCNMVLDCGMCHPPQHCGAVTPNVCGR